MGLSIYRKGQGKITRYTSAACLAALLFLGAYQLYGFLVGFKTWYDPLFGFTIPIVEQPFNLAFVSAAIVLCGGGWFLFWFLNRKTSVDLLIETETELKKVTWPSWAETLNSSVVVIACVIIISVYLAFSDLILSRFFGIFF